MPGVRDGSGSRKWPLDTFIGETTSLLSREVIPDDVLVRRVKLPRRAEAEGRYAETFTAAFG